MTPIEPAASEAHDPVVSALARQQSEGIAQGSPLSDPHDNGATAGGRPSFLSSKSALLEWAYEDYYRRLEEGERPDLEAYCARFPSCRSSLRRLLQVDLFLEGNRNYLDSEKEPGQEIPWPIVGEQRGDLTLKRELGRGAFARVYLATEASTGDRPVAVKFSIHGDAEARTLGRLSHPHVVPVLSACLEESTGLTRVCMPYLGSATLEDMLDRIWSTPDAPRPRKAADILEVIRDCAQPEDPPDGPIHPRLQKGDYADGVIHLAIQLAEALAFLHDRHVCHRDLKPSNVLLDPSGKPLLLDFNLSTSEREVAVPTGGTLGYMAPEQIHAFLNKSSEGLDERADLFAFGVIIYELLTGAHPFGPIPADLTGEPLAHFLLERLKTGFQLLYCVCPELERPVATILDRCLAVDPADRPGSAGELAVELKRQFSLLRRMRRWVAARPRMMLTVVCLLFTAAGAGYAWSLLPSYSDQEYQRGETAYRASNYDEAEKHFNQALQADPNNPRLRFARGCARLKQSKYLQGDKSKLDDKLNQAWDDLVPKNQQEGRPDGRTLAVKAYIESRKQNALRAIGAYDQIEQTGYRPAMVRNNRAYCHWLRRQYKEAQVDLDVAAQLDPNCQAIFYNRAMLTFQILWNASKGLENSTLSLHSQALAEIERALQLGPTTPDLYRDAALVYTQAACNDLRRVFVSLDVPLETALRLGIRQQRIERALFFLRRAIEEGQPADSILKDRFLRRSLGICPGFENLGKVKRQRTIRSMELRLIDPIDLDN